MKPTVLTHVTDWNVQTPN